MFIGTTEDITDLKRIELELAAARDAAMHSAQLKANFLGNVSHEVRTPMNGVMGMLDLLSETALDGQQRRYTDIARESATVLMRLLEDILDFSRLEAGRLRLSPVPFSPALLVRESCESFLAKAESYSARARCSKKSRSLTSSALLPDAHISRANDWLSTRAPTIRSIKPTNPTFDINAPDIFRR